MGHIMGAIVRGGGGGEGRMSGGNCPGGDCPGGRLSGGRLSRGRFSGARIIGVKTMFKFDFLFGCIIGKTLLNQTDNLSKTLQKVIGIGRANYSKGY